MKKTFLSLFILICTFMGSAQNYRLSEQLGNFISCRPVRSGVEIQATNAVASVTAYNATTIRFRINKSMPHTDFSYAIDNLIPDGACVLKSETEKCIVLTTDSLIVEVQKNPLRFSVKTIDGNELCTDDAGLGVSWYGNQVSVYKKLHPDEKFIGLGEKTGSMNRRGQFFRHWNTDAPAYATDQDPLYSTIPFFVGIHNQSCYGIFFDNTHQSYVNFGGGADENIYHFGADDGEMNYYFFGAQSVSAIVRDYTGLTGRTPMPPLWSLGFQQSRWGYDSPEQFQSLAHTFREKKLPADVLVCDINYMDNYKVFTWSPVFRDVKGLTTQMKQLNFDMVTIIDPGVKIEKGYKAYDDGIAKSCFAKYPDGRLYVGSVWPGRCHFPDFTQAAVRDWWGENFKASHVDNGIRGFWNDMNEPAAWGREFPNLIEFGTGENKQTLFQVKNVYGLLMAKATYEGTKKAMNGQRPFVLTRASYAGVQKYSAQWTGDNVSSDEHMLLGFRLLNSMALSGVSFVGMDVGGFMGGNLTTDLYLRWMSISLFSPLYRSHTSINSTFREPWQFGEEATAVVRKSLELRYQLMPHLYSSFYQSHLTGVPVNRMLPIEYTHDEKVYEKAFENQFFFGDGLLVCPVASTQQLATVYLPGNCRWYRFSNDQEQYDGGKVYHVDAPVSNLPVFVRGGSIIPMQSVVQSTKDKSDGILYVHLWKGTGKTNYTYYEDDGETYRYENEISYSRKLCYDATAGVLTLSAVRGNFQSRYNQLQVVLHGFAASTVPAVSLKNTEMKIELRK